MDFDRWLNEQGRPKPAPEPEPVKLPIGLWDRDGRIYFLCRGCGRSVELPCDPSEYTWEGAFCGGSPYCLP